MRRRAAAVTFAAVGLFAGMIGVVLLFASLRQPDGSSADEGRWLVIALAALTGSGLLLAAARRAWTIHE